MSVEYQLEKLKQKTPEEVVALDQLKTRKDEKLKGMNAEELAQLYQKELKKSFNFERFLKIRLNI